MKKPITQVSSYPSQTALPCNITFLKKLRRYLQSHPGLIQVNFLQKLFVLLKRQACAPILILVNRPCKLPSAQCFVKVVF